MALSKKRRAAALSRLAVAREVDRPAFLVHGAYMNAPKFAKLSIHNSSKVKIAPVYPDFDCSFGLLSLMGAAG